jgi:hypothetical protein
MALEKPFLLQPIMDGRQSVTRHRRVQMVLEMHVVSEKNDRPELRGKRSGHPRRRFDLGSCMLNIRTQAGRYDCQQVRYDHGRQKPREIHYSNGEVREYPDHLAKQVQAGERVQFVDVERCVVRPEIPV